jgi:hypothetical protein
MKKVSVFNGAELVSEIDISKETKIGDVKKQLSQYSIVKMNINDVTELKVFATSKYDRLTFESIWDQIENAKILVTKRIGKIRIAQQAKGKSYPIKEGFENIPCWSRGKGEWKLLSPFYLKFAEGAIFENFWQSFKVWENITKQKTKTWEWPAEKHVDDEGNPNEKWEKWHESLLHHDEPVRRPNGKAVPLYSYWNGRHLNLIEARKEIYISYLKQLYRANPVYLKLLEKVRAGKNIMLIEPDGPLLDAYPEGLEVNLPLLYSLIERTNYADEGFPDRYRPYGHGYVLATCLLEDT